MARVDRWREERVCQRGLSLLEVLLAAMLFAVTIGGVATTWRYHELSLEKYQNRNTARYLAQCELSEIAARSYVTIDSRKGANVQELERTIDGVKIKQPFTVTTDVEENAGKTLKTVTVTVSFVEKNETKQLKVRTRVARGQ